MASTYTCKACCRALRSQHRPFITASRQFHLTPRHLTTPKPAPPAAAESDPEPPHPYRTPGLSDTAYLQSRISSSLNAPRAGPSGLAPRIADAIRERAPNLTETYVAYGSTREMFFACAARADYTIPQAQMRDVELPKNAQGEDVGVGKGGWWLDELKLPPTFATWAQVTFLHMYILLTRLRLFPAAHTRDWQQHLVDHFFITAEERMAVVHQLHSASIRQRYLKDLFAQWRGAMLSYDEGLVRGDAVLAAAVWRNVLKAEESVDAKALAEVVSWFRKEMARLDQMTDAELAERQFVFSSPGDEAAGVMMKSKLMAEEST